MKTLVAVAFLTMASIVSALADCPVEANGSSADIIAKNQERLVCLNQQVSTDATQKRFETQLQDNQTAIQNLQIQRRLDSLPELPVFTPPAPGLTPGR